MPLSATYDRDRLIAPKGRERVVSRRCGAWVDVRAGFGPLPIIERHEPVGGWVRRVWAA